jgi:O-antigen ligase
VDESVVDAHSLVIETAAELGIAGLLALGVMLGGVGACARRAYRLAPEASAGAAAVAAAWMTHSLLDWDWELPAVTLMAIACAGALIAAADRGAAVSPPRPRRAERAGAAR